MVEAGAFLEQLSQYAHEPALVYGMLALFFTASSFGLPIPEEVMIVSAGLLAYAGQTSDSPATAIQPVTTAMVCFVSVFLSDFLVYGIGRYGGQRLLKYGPFRKATETATFQKILDWNQKYGAWMAGLFRFTPGLRFPGHLACGSLGVPAWKFVATDGVAALLTVPTQVLLLAYYGDVILEQLKNVKIVLLAVGVTALLVFVFRRLLARKRLQSFSSFIGF